LDQKFYTSKLQRAIFFFPSIPIGLLLAYIWGFILASISSGVFNPIPCWPKYLTIVVAAWAATGWHAVLYLAFLQSIPKDYYEPAAIGAGRW
jgi:raffinose/stachyose/melibiose transport system permease protein